MQRAPRPSAVPATVTVVRSNRLERLADALADVVREPRGGVLAGECIVVPGRALAVWLGRELANRLGVWLGGDFVYPRNFVERALGAVLGPASPKERSFEAERLAWGLFDLLPELWHRPELGLLRRHAETDERGRFELAGALGRLFDRYLVFRPDMLRAWERGDDRSAATEPWQPLLWRALVARFGDRHPAALEPRYLAALAAPAGLPPEVAAALPPRVSLFVPTSLPPLYVRVVAALARHVEVHAFFLSPCREHWTEAWRGAAAEPPPEHHPLLASLGRTGADFAELWQEELERLEVGEQEPLDAHEEPAGTSLLAELQRDLLLGRPPPGPPGTRAADGSVALHACHGPLREVEALHGELLRALGDVDAPLEPGDVGVLVSDLETYGPLVDAVFDRDRHDPTFIPYRVAGRATRRECPVADALVRLCALARARLTASEVLDFLALEPVHRAAELAPAELETVARWVEQCGIRWGVDAAHRAAHGQPASHANTWRFGLERLLVGHALPPASGALFGGVLGHDVGEGDAADLLGRFAGFAERLFGWLERLRGARALAAWRTDLGLAAELLLWGDGDGWQHELVRRALAALADDAAAAGCDAPCGLEVVESALGAALDRARPDPGPFGGGVCFGTLGELAAVPFEVVCLLGFGAGQFPRRPAELAFDLCGHPARRGDPDVGHEDRYRLLAAVCAARRRLCVTYTGQSARDDANLPPASPIVGLEAAAAATTALALRHPLQPWSRRYFDGSDARLASFERVHLEGARAACAPPRPAPPFFSGALPAPRAADAPVSLAELLHFFRGPARYLFERVLGVELPDVDDAPEDREPLALDALEVHRLGARVLEHRLGGVGEHESEILARAAGLLPPGAAGVGEHRAAYARARAMQQALEPSRRAPARPPLVLDRVTPSGVRLVGALDGVWGRGLSLCRHVRVGGREWLELWLRHLCLCWVEPGGPGPESVLVARPASDEAGQVARLRLGPVEAPAARLDELVALFRSGSSAPLELFPTASLHYAERVARDGEPSAALASARALLRRPAREGQAAGELVAGYTARAFGAGYEPAERFAELALAVFGPLLACAEPDPGAGLGGDAGAGAEGADDDRAP
ncbi:MAG: exodeoxyribonuclease V subunit gamma [Polyangiaceae bacterium]|nr:exodeoxyribonuclease V subunit gamma [Polyangiaceae bacterium]